VTKPSVNKEQIMYAWTFINRDAEMAAISIGQDSIFYVDEMTSYPYKLIGDSIRITYPDTVFTGSIFFKNDTLVLTEREFGMLEYYRWK
jgi:hypothetical protein